VKLNDLKNENELRHEPLCLWVADDDRMVRELVTEVLTQDGTLRCEREFSCAEKVIATLKREASPDVIVLDINMGGMTGIEAIAPIQAIARSTSIFIMTTFYDSARESGAMRAGAAGFFVKTECREQTVEQIRAAAARARSNTPVFEGRNPECVPALRVSAPGRLSSAKSNTASPLILRTFNLLREFVLRE
jgi:DNA-binding NarL/FixJ family response regulator